MSDQPTKEELSANVQYHLNKEEIYAKYGPYVSEEVYNQYKGIPTKDKAPYPQTIFPNVPDELQDNFKFASLRNSPERNYRDLAILQHYDDLGVLPEYQPRNVDAYEASVTLSNLGTANNVYKNRVNDLRLSRRATADVIEFNLKNDPVEYAKYMEAREHIGRAADYYGMPEEVVQLANTNHLYNTYYKEFSDDKYGKVTRAYLASPVGKAATPDDLKILRELAASQDEDISGIINDSNVFTRVYNLQQYALSLYDKLKKGEANSQDVNELNAVYGIINQYAANESIFSSILGGAYSWLAYIPQDIASMLNANNYGYVSNNQEILQQQFDAPMVDARTLQSGLGGVKLWETFALERTRRENIPQYVAIAAQTGKSINQVIKENKDNFDLQLAANAAMSATTVLLSNVGSVGSSLALPVIEKTAATASGRALALTAVDIGTDAVVNAVATAPFEGIKSASQYELAASNNLSTEYDSITSAFIGGMTNNFVGNLAAGGTFGLLWNLPRIYTWGKDALDVARVDKTFQEAGEVKQLSTLETAPEATKKSVHDTLKQQGYQEKNVYFYTGDLHDILNDDNIDLSWMSQQQRDFLFGKLNNDYDATSMMVFNREDLAYYFKETPLEKVLNDIAHDSTTATSKAELDLITKTRRDGLNEIGEQNPDLIVNSAEELAAAKSITFHNLQDQISTIIHDEVSSLGLPNISIPDITYASREVAGIFISVIEDANIPINDALKFFEKHKPSFALRRSVLDIESGHAADKVRGTYDANTHTIELGANADITTLVHELSHHYLEFAMHLADEMPDNARLQKLKYEAYAGFTDKNPDLLNTKWADIDPELKELIQEAFAYNYIRRRVERTFSPDDYTAANVKDEEGHKTGRSFAGAARLDRSIATAWARFMGIDLRGMTDEQKRAAIHSTLGTADANFQRDYNIGQIPPSLDLVADFVDGATASFEDVHRIANLYPMGESVLDIPNLTAEEMQNLKNARDLLYDDLHGTLRFAVGSASQGEIRNMDKMFQMRKKDIENNPEYREMLREQRLANQELEDSKANVANIQGAIDQQNKNIDALNAEYDSINTPEYRKESGKLKSRATRLSNKIEKNNQKIADVTAQSTKAANDYAAEVERNEANRIAYENSQAATAAQQTIVDTEEATLARYKELRDEAKAQGDKESATIAHRMVKSQESKVRRAHDKLNTLKEQEAKAFNDYNESAIKAAQLIETEHNLAAQIDELVQDNINANNELLQLNEKLAIDPAADIKARINQIKQDIAAIKASLKEANQMVKDAERKVAAYKRQYAKAEQNWAKEMAELNKMYDNAEVRLQTYRNEAAKELDNGEGVLGELYQDALLWQRQLNEAPEGDPLWNDAMDHFGATNIDELKQYLSRNTNREELIEQRAAEMYANGQRAAISQERIDEMTLTTAAKVLRMYLNFLEGKTSKEVRSARNVAKRSAMLIRNRAGLLVFGNTSPNALLRRAQTEYLKAQRVFTRPNKYNSNEDMFIAAYDHLTEAEYFTQLALTGVRMKAALQTEIRKIRRTLTAKGVNDHINADHVLAAKDILSRIGIIRSGSSVTILRQVQKEFPDQWALVAPFLENTSSLHLQDYSKMQMGDLKAVLDLVNSIIGHGEQVLAFRKSEQAQAIREVSREARANLDKYFADRPRMAAIREATDAVNAPEKQNLTGLQKLKALISSIRNQTLTLRTVCEIFDGGEHGPLKRGIFNPVADANNAYIMADRELGKKLEPEFERARELFNPRSQESKDLGLNEPIVWRDRDGKEVTIVPAPDGNIRKALVGVLVHIGNESNFSALCRTLNIDEDVMVRNIRELERRGIINEALMDHVQAYWDAYKPIGIKAQEAYNKINNARYKPIEGRQINMCGKTYAGGYAPLVRKRNKFLSPNVSFTEQMADAALDLPPSFDPSFAKERSESSTLPLDLSYDGVINGLSRQLRFAYIYPPLHQVSLFFKANPDIMRDLEIAIPGFQDEVFIPWMRAVANQTSSDIRINDGLRALGNAGARLNQSIMAANISNAAQQLAGFIVATAKVSTGYLLRYIVKPMSREEIFELSPHMRIRLEDNKKNLSILRRDLRSYGKASRFKNWLDDHAYIVQVVTQNWIDQRVWSAKYQEQLAKGISPQDAVKAADNAVVMTQSSFNVVDSSAFDRDPVSKILVPFMNYFQSMANLWRARVVQVNAGVDSRVRRSFNSIMLALQIMVIPSVVGYAIAQSIKGFWVDSDEKDAIQFMEDATASAATGLLSSIHPFAGQAASIAYNIYQGKPTQSSIINAPIANLIPSAIRSSGNIYDCVVNGEDLSSYDVTNVLHMANAMGVWPALGTAASTRAFVIGAMATGNADTDSAIDAARAALTGNLSEAQRGKR